MTNYDSNSQNDRSDGGFTVNSQSQNDMAFLAQLKSIQNLVTIATIAGPVSLLIGGMLLGTIAVICGALAVHKLNKLPIQNSSHAELVGKVKRSAYIAIGISVAALVVNGVFVALMMPEVLAAIETGDLSILQGDGVSSFSDMSSSSETSSVWG